MISVCMATYNGGKYVERQALSILSQLGENDELIVSDDNSTDDTLLKLRNLEDARIHIYDNNRPSGHYDGAQLVTLNFENALRHAKGDYIFLSDQDDVWKPNKVEVMMQWLKDYDYVQSDCIITDSNLNEREDLRHGRGINHNRWTSLVGDAPYMGCLCAVSRRLLDKALPFPKGLQSHDRWLGFLGSIFFKYKLIPDKLIYYCKHDDNISSAFSNSRNSLGYRIKTRLNYILFLITRMMK